ncbi:MULTISPECIES: DUF2491 family protein [Pseudomonas]|uniref:DUF2491 family protein n=1 Tax=Pseudomonas chlororaphis TaxID=587753 RepID=A0A0D5Y1J0_9PSED|nr:MULTISPECIES: DUF2491 family protein [Pseudomonas]AJO78277.1 hypothetical protein TO66_13600 [Pseudomonas sp. MRSN 12121]AKA24844.1 hypothetical protein PCL1606_33930 [Pseudomonas chlororaphis]MCB2254521.1 YjfK family protein [Pseudomonas chlororaphis]
MGWFKRFMGLQAPTSTAAVSSAGPLGLNMGASVRFDASLRLLLDGKTGVVIPGDQAVYSEGRVDLGQSEWLSRYYLDDEDYWLQVHTSGGVDGEVKSVILFNYLSNQAINSEAELRRLAGPNSLIGRPSYSLDGVEYQREWGTEAGQTELVPLHEQVSKPDETFSFDSHSMLYARETGLTNRREFLLFSVEQYADGSVSLVSSLGISLYMTDLQTL